MGGPTWRLLVWLVFAAIAMACDDGASETSNEARLSDAASDCGQDEPPGVVMESPAGRQVGVQGSYCAGRAGCGLSCLDRGVAPRQFTFLRPGDEITFSMAEGKLVAGKYCEPACPPTLRVQSARCRPDFSDQQPYVRELPIIEDEPWVVDLDPGTYEAWLDTHFDENDDGWSGGIYVGFGLVVDPAHERSVIDAAELTADCEPIDADAG